MIINFVILLMFLSTAYLGYKKGIISEAAYVLGSLLGFCMVPILYKFLVPEIRYEIMRMTNYNSSMLLISKGINAIVMIATKSFIWALAFFLARRLVKVFLNIVKNKPKVLSTVDRLAGSGFGVLQVVIFIWVFSLIISCVPFIPFQDLQYKLQESGVYAFVAQHNMLLLLL